MIQIMDSYKDYVPHDVDGDPVPLVLYCDGLSCERVECAQRARINGADKWTRLEGYEPGIQEWHRRLMYLQVLLITIKSIQKRMLYTIGCNSH